MRSKEGTGSRGKFVSMLSGWKLIWYCRTLLWWISVQERWGRFWHCRKGYHRCMPNSQIVTNSRGLRLETHYISCPTCGIIYFPTKEDKDAYIRIKDREHAQMQNLIEQMKKHGDEHDEHN
jgi:hypothetical protein